MKKVYIIILMFLSLLLISCNDKKLSFNVNEVNLNKGETFQLIPNENIKDIHYKTEDEKVAVVTITGLIIAVDTGNTTIDATFDEYTIKIKVVVSEKHDPKPEVRNLAVYFIDVGQADAIFIELPNGETMMIDAGYGYEYEMKAWENITTLLDSLKFEKIDHFIITHNHQDHYGFVPDIISRYGIDNIYGSGSVRYETQYRNIMNSIKNAGLEYLVVEVGDILIDEEYLTVQVIASQKKIPDDEPNFSSVMLKLVYKDTSFLFTGDAGIRSYDDAEYIALESGLDLSADVLKVGHHGSSYSSGNPFLNAVKPKYAILTTQNDSRDGLPKQDSLNRIKAVGATIYQTKDNGTIILNSNGKELSITTEK